MLIERDRELAALDALMAEAASGRGHTVLITGAAGIGKTALMKAAQQRGHLRPLAASGGELELDLPFAVVRQLLEPALFFPPPSPAGPPPLTEDALSGAAALARPVFEDGRVTGDVSSVLHGLYWVCSNLADARPLLLAIDDFHWADEASLRFVSHLARRVADLPILLVLARRPGAPGDLAARALSGADVRTIDLEPISADGIGVLVREMLHTEPDDEFSRACAEASGGNPFLLTEALISLRSAGVRPVAAQAARVAQLQPESISRAVLGRLNALGPQAIALARAVAVLGPAAEPRRVAALADVPMREAAELVDRLAAESIVRPGRPLEFVHPLVRTAVYTDSSSLVRATDHKRAAALLEAEGVPAENHLLISEPEADPWVVRTLRRAAAGALAQGAPEVAAACLQRALAEPPPIDERAEVTAELGRSLSAANRPDEATEALRTAYELSTNDDEKIEIALHLGTLMAMTGRGAEAVAAFELVPQDVRDADMELDARSTAVFLLSFAAMRPPPGLIARIERLTRTMTGTGEHERMILAGLAFGAAATGDRTAAETIELARRAADGPVPRQQGWQLVNFASSAMAISDSYPEALALLDVGMEDARRRGNVNDYRYLAILRSHTALHGGQLLEAEADGRTAYELSHDGGQGDTPLAAAVLIDALVDRGDLAQAQQILAEAGLEGEPSMNMLTAHFVMLARGRLRLAQNRPHEALADLLHCGQALVGPGYVNPAFAPWRAEAAQAHARLSSLDAARALLDEDLELARKFGAPRAVGVALHARAMIEGGSVDLLAEALAALESSTATLEAARVRIDYGSALRRAGRKTEALEPLRAGLDAVTRCGATELASHAAQELIAAGARPRRALRSGPESLTASELRVARLAAQGTTNRDIAQALFVSRRTVEIHLTNAYRKLGIDSRQQLSELL